MERAPPTFAKGAQHRVLERAGGTAQRRLQSAARAAEQDDYSEFSKWYKELKPRFEDAAVRRQHDRAPDG
eukprot:5426239-Prymnesium_polylepis.1